MIPFEGSDEESACHLFVVILERGVSRKLVMSRMMERGIQTSIHYPPTHRFTFFRRAFPETADLKITDDIGNRLLTLPLFPDMSREQVNLVCSALRDAVQDLPGAAQDREDQTAGTNTIPR